MCIANTITSLCGFGLVVLAIQSEEIWFAGFFLAGAIGNGVMALINQVRAEQEEQE